MRIRLFESFDNPKTYNLKKWVEVDSTHFSYYIKEEMLTGVAEQLTVIRDKYSKDSYGYTAIQEIISDINGGKNVC